MSGQGERWFMALPYRAKSGVALVDVRAKTLEDQGMGSRFVCSTTPDDAEQIVADHNARLAATDAGAAGDAVAAMRAALEAAGRDLIGFHGHFDRLGSHGTAQNIQRTLDKIDAALLGAAVRDGGE